MNETYGEKGPIDPGEKPESKQEGAPLPPDLLKKMVDLEKMRNQKFPDWVRPDVEKNIKRIQEEIDREREKLFTVFEKDIPLEFKKDLLDAARFSNTPEKYAMMTPELRRMLKDIRENHMAYFYGHPHRSETPHGEADWTVTANKKSKREFEFIEGEHYIIFGLAGVSHRKPFDSRVTYFEDGERTSEEFGIAPAKNNDWTATYVYKSWDMLTTGNTPTSRGSNGGELRIALAISENEARELYSQFLEHPEFLREFFVCAGRDAEGEFVKVILEGKPGKQARKVDWEKTDERRKIKFMEFDGDKYKFQQIESQGGELRQVALPRELQEFQDEENQRIITGRQWKKEREEKERLEREAGFLKKAWKKIWGN